MLNNILTLTAHERDWLENPESLTKRLRLLTNNKITHHLFYDDWCVVDAHYRAALSLPLKIRTWVRKMEWQYDDEIWVACSVIIPETSITSETQELMHIEKKSIGDILFQDETLSRSEFVFYKNAESNWTRHSIFYFKKKPLLIIENFKPAFFAKITS